MEDSADKLLSKVSEWLTNEGYPLEFRVAHRFREAGFSVFQGTHIPDKESGKPREIDVIGVKTLAIADTKLYCVCLAECKWSKSKPWILFSSPDKGSGTSSMISSLIASDLGEGVLHLLAADEELQKESYFDFQSQTAFSGRVAFAKPGDSDVFYSAVQSTIAKSLLVAKIDDPQLPENSMPYYGSIVLPMVVIDGALFEASYNPKTDAVELQRRGNMRLGWSARGAESHIINVVSFEYLHTFIADLSHTVDVILARSEPVLKELIECFEKQRQYPEIPEVDRAYSGEPDILIRLRALQEKKSKTGHNSK